MSEMTQWVYVLGYVIVGLAFYGLYNIIIRVVSRFKIWHLGRKRDDDSQAEQKNKQQL